MTPTPETAELTLYFYPSPSPGIDWTTPGSLIRTAGLYKALSLPRAIGHVSVRVRAPGKAGEEKPIDFHVGMTQLRPREGRTAVMLQGHALGMLFYKFEGRLEEKEELDLEIAGRARDNGRLSYLRIQISDETARRLADFLDGYRASDGPNHYGFPFRPLHREGGGCSAFAAAFLEIAGLLDEEYKKNWTRLMRVPTRLIGGPTTGKWVSPLKLFGTKSWAVEGEDQKEIFFWDPDLMHQWTVREHQKALSGQSEYHAERLDNALGLSVDRRSVPTPSGPIFQD